VHQRPEYRIVQVIDVTYPSARDITGRGTISLPPSKVVADILDVGIEHRTAVEGRGILQGRIGEVVLPMVNVGRSEERDDGRDDLEFTAFV